MTPNNYWLTSEGRADLRRLLDGPGWLVGSLQMGSSSPARAGLEAAMAAVIPLLDALEAAERERNEALAREAKLRDAAEWVVKSWGEPDADENSFDADLRAALALPADRTALDALLAEARHEGARACVDAARTAAEALDECQTDNPDCADGARAVCKIVERAAASFDTKEKP